MPNRIIKESICTSDTVDALTWFEEVLFYRLIVNCDDYGRYDARPAIIRGKLFPLKDVTVKQVNEAIIKLSTVGIAKLYEVDGNCALGPTIRASERRKANFPRRMSCMHLKSIACRCMQMIANAPVIQSNPNPIRIQNPNPKRARRALVSFGLHTPENRGKARRKRLGERSNRTPRCLTRS